MESIWEHTSNHDRFGSLNTDMKTDELTWDCPCHGSRFSQEGNLIDNPATGNLKK